MALRAYRRALAPSRNPRYDRPVDDDRFRRENRAIDDVGLAKSLGVPGELVEKTADVGPAMKRGLASGGPYLIDARIDGSFKG